MASAIQALEQVELASTEVSISLRRQLKTVRFLTQLMVDALSVSMGITQLLKSASLFPNCAMATMSKLETASAAKTD